MMKKIVLSTLILLFLGAAAGLAQPPEARWWNKPEVAKRLALTDADKSRLEAVFTESQRRRIELRSAVAKERFDLDTALADPKAGDQALAERYQRVIAAQNALASERFAFILKTRQILGPARFQTLKSIFEDWRKEHAGEWRGRGPRKGAGPPPYPDGDGPPAW